MIRTLQAPKFVSSWKSAASTAFQNLSARRNPSAQGPLTSILTPIVPRRGSRRRSYFPQGASTLVQLERRSSIARLGTWQTQPSHIAVTPARNRLHFCMQLREGTRISTLPSCESPRFLRLAEATEWLSATEPSSISKFPSPSKPEFAKFLANKTLFGRLLPKRSGLEGIHCRRSS